MGTNYPPMDSKMTPSSKYLLLLLLPFLCTGCYGDGFLCGQPLTSDPNIIRKCDRPHEVCICSTNKCARRVEMGICSSLFEYTDPPFGPPISNDSTSRCVTAEEAKTVLDQMATQQIMCTNGADAK